MRLRNDNYKRRGRFQSQKMSRGRQQWDEVTGFLAYEYDLAEDAYGNMVDTRHPENFDNPDTFTGGIVEP